MKQASFHIRTKRGDFSESTDSSLERLVLVEKGKIAISDIDKGLIVATYDLPDLEEGQVREASFTQMGEQLFVATTVDGVPEELVMVIDDAIIPVNVPALPFSGVHVVASGSPVITGVPYYDVSYKIRPGYYGMRLAWEFGDYHGPLSEPFMIYLPRWLYADDGIGAYTQSYVGPRYDKLRVFIETGLSEHPIKKISSGIAVYMCEPATDSREDSDGVQVVYEENPAISIHENLYRYIGTVSVNDVGEKSLFKAGEYNYNPTVYDSYVTLREMDSIRQGVLAEEDVLAHKVKAGIVDGYNSRLLLGGTEVNWRNPFARYGDYRTYPRMIDSGNPDPTNFED